MAKKSSKKKDGGQDKSKHGNRYDWDLIKRDYVTNPKSSLKKIAEKYGIHFTTVNKHSKADNWFATKKEYQKEVQAKVLAKCATKQADELAKELASVDNIADRIQKMLADEDQFNRHIVQETELSDSGIPMTVTTEKIFTKTDVRAMKDALQSLKMIEEMKRSMLDLQRAEVLHRAQIEKERLALEREKFEWEKQKAEYARPDTTNSIKIEGLEEGWAE